ncbi:MAG: hypothetical protein PW788_06520 [Micavibrio sp.]|nr:hypothetical protein [Micavibrio sp.]
MMKRFVLLAAILFPLALSAAPAAAQLTQAQQDAHAAALTAEKYRGDLFYTALNASAAAGNIADTLKVLADGVNNKVGAEDPREVALQWLLDNTFDQNDQAKINAMYFKMLADLEIQRASSFQQMGRVAPYTDATEMALRAIMTYEILAITDAERCDDPSVSKIVEDSVVPTYRDLSYSYTIVTKERFDILSYYSSEYERLKNDRPVNVFLCSKGDKAKADPKFKPKDLDAAEWTKKRNELRGLYKNLWSETYYTFKPKAQ